MKSNLVDSIRIHMKMLWLLLIFVTSLIQDGWAQINQTHPRLWIRQQDIPLLQAKAHTGNPYFVSLRQFAEDLKDEMGGAEYESQFSPPALRYATYPAETMAMVFAFMSMITTGDEQADYANRAHQICMRIIQDAALGQADGLPWRDESYAVSDRSRWYGMGLPLAIDWVYYKFSSAEKQQIRTAFLRWCDENTHATTTTDNHPLPLEPGGDHPVKLSPSLLLNQDDEAKSHRRLRYSLNNFYLSHIRSLWLMSSCLDNADDPDGSLHAYMDDVTGAWAYVSNIAANSELAGKGGLSPEGFLYGPSAYGRWAQAVLAMYTSGEARPEVPIRGEQSTFNPDHWNELLPAILNSISPQPQTSGEFDYTNVYLPMNYGSIQRFKIEDMIDLFGPLGWYYTISNSHPEALNAIKWFQIHMPQGGAASMNDRIGYSQGFFERALFYFMIFNPGDNPADPRVNYPTTWYAQGIGRILSRTDWTDQASVFGFKCGYNRIDHQLGDGLSFSLYRKGAFLTSQLNGYDFDTGVSSCLNSLAIENNPVSDDGPQVIAHQYGSQWFLNAEGEGTIPFWSDHEEYLFATGDATGLYNYVNPWITPTGDDVSHASRSIIWLKPDYLVIYDRATSKTPDRYKQFWMSLPNQATVTGKVATVPAANNQYLHITNLLPANAVITPKNYTHDGDANGYDEPAANDPMTHRLMVEDPSNPLSVRFLHVLQGRDQAQPALPASWVATTDNQYEGATVGERLILFKRDLNTVYPATLEFAAPGQVESVILTGIRPLTSYAVSIMLQPDGSRLVTVTEAPGYTADNGGTVFFSLITEPRNITDASQLAGITVPVGTAFNDLPLPTQVTVTLSDGSIGLANVVFSSTGYVPGAVGEYTLSGVLVPFGNVTNTGGRTVTIVVTTIEVNHTPADISLSNQSLEEGLPVQTMVGTLTTTDADANDTHTYALVPGSGDEHNAMFMIQVDQLLTNTQFEVEQDEAFNILIQSSDQEGAIITKPFVIEVSSVDTFMPNLFTPNNDGVNDVFRIRSTGIQSVTLKVIDRQGVVVYETHDITEATTTGWDGTYRGKELPTGTYTWLITGSFSNGKDLTYKGKKSGNITLIR
jgi:gliding motility-associated-like protein